MRRSTELERVEQEAELLLRLLGADAHDLEDALLHVAAVDTDRAAADLVAVADDVVRVREGLARVLLEAVDPLRGRRREGVVHRGPGTLADGHVVVLTRGLEQRRVDDPHERPGVLVDQATAAADLEPRGTEQGAGLRLLAGGEEDRVARLRARRRGETSALVVRDVLGDRAAELAVLAHRHVREALGTALLGPLLPRVEPAPRRARTTRLHDRADVRHLEHAERRAREVRGEVHELETEAQVGLVRPVLLHGLGVRHAVDRRRDLDVDQAPQRDQHLLGDRDDVVLLDEAHLDVELGELGLPVGAEVLVAVAACDLVVPLEAGDHEELLEQLRRLRQRVPAARRQARGHEEVASALGRGTREGRRLDLDEVVRVEDGACGLAHPGAQLDRARGSGPAQVEVAIAQARLLADLLVERRRDLERQGRGLVQDDHVGRDHLDLARHEVRVLVALGPTPDLAGHLQHELRAQPVRDSLVPDDDLGDARRVTQVHERDAAVIAPAVHPAREGDGGADVLGPQRAGGVGAQHGRSFRSGITPGRAP